VPAGEHEGIVRVGDVDTVPIVEALEQKTELDWFAVRKAQEVTDDKRTTPSAMAKKTARTPNRNLRDILLRLPTVHARIEMKQRCREGRD
jgi:hypothetical protein